MQVSAARQAALAARQQRAVAVTAAAQQAAAAEQQAADAGQRAGPCEATQRAGKRKVALFIGYEGTEYRGLQMQPNQALPLAAAPEATVEDALEEAIFRAGGILPSNRGQLSKVSWSRSSRTDKSVHSLATVVGLKMEVQPDSFNSDPEGAELAAAINAHLPPEVRVFSIQRVSKSWNARSECIRRTYSYYLPASALGLALDGGECDEKRLALLAAAWQRFEGTHPFHNYTKRRLYREGEGGGSGGRRRKSRAEQDAEAAASSEAGSEGSEPEPDCEGGAGAGATAAAAAAPAPAGDGPSPAAGAEGAPAAAGEAVPARKGRVVLQWKTEKDASDLVVRRHFRFIEWCRADTEVKSLVPGGEPCIHLSLQGGSFMLHQIRHMVAAAVAVARGALPLELLEASLATPARVNLPLAPPSTLMLTGAQFSPFKRSWSGQAAAAAQWTGDTLELRERGAAAQQEFLREVMLPALDGLLAGEEWAQWQRDLDALWYDERELQQLLGSFASWREERRAMKVAALLQEAAAQHARDDD
ncbi:hypothetical protein ABPG77_007673 [Micractinium sp. CCAP 211/92]